MFLELLAATLIGVTAGIFTGLTPGVHINLVSAIILSLSAAAAAYVPMLALCVVIVSMAITHTFLDTIPSIFLGAPEDEKALGVLPGHRYLLRGNGLMAVKLCMVGGIAGTIIAALLFLPVMWLIGLLADLSQPYLFWIMLGFVLFSVLKDQKPFWAGAIFLLSGTLGLVALRLPLGDVLLPLLSGMFGVATLLYSINEHQEIPPQRDERYTQLDARKTAAGSFLGVAGGFLTALFPGISASIASAVASKGADLGDHGFLILLGSMGSASFVLSLAAFVAIEKARNGAIAVVVQLAAMTPAAVLILMGAMLAATGIAALLTLQMGRSAAKWLPRIPYRATCIGVIAFVAGIVLIRSGPVGFLVLVVSTAVGLLPAALKTARAQGMGCLLLPLLVALL